MGTWLFWLFWLLSIRTSLSFLANLSYSSSSVRSDHRSRPLFHIRAAVLKALWPSHNLVLLKLAQILLTSTLRFSLAPKYIPYTNSRHGDERIRYSNMQVMESSQYAEKRCCWLGISTLCSWGLHKHILGSVAGIEMACTISPSCVWFMNCCYLFKTLSVWLQCWLENEKS